MLLDLLVVLAICKNMSRILSKDQEEGGDQWWSVACKPGLLPD